MTKHFWVNPNLTIIPKLTPNDLEKLVNYLPRPDNICFSVKEGSKPLDYSALKQRLKEESPIFQNIYQKDHFPNPSEAIFDFSYAKKEFVLGLYQKFYQYLYELQTKDYKEPFNLDSLIIKFKHIEWAYTGSTYFWKEWEQLGDTLGLNIFTTSDQVHFFHPVGNELPIIGSLKEKLVGTKAELLVTPYDPQDQTTIHTLAPIERKE